MMRPIRGVSLVELMIAMVLGLLLLTVLLRIFSDSREAVALQQALMLSEGEGAVALDLIAHDLRSAGNWGCQPRRVHTDGLPGNSAWRNYTRMVEAWSAAEAPDELLPTTLDLLPDSDVLAIRFSGNEQWPALGLSGDTLRLPLTQRESGACPGGDRFNGLCPGDPVLVSHCGGGRISRITDAAEAASTTGQLLLTLQPAPPFHQADTTVRPVHTRIWFMARRRDGSAGLFMREDGGRTREVASGAHQLTARFASPGADFLPPDAVEGWPTITAVELRLQWHSEGGPDNGRILATTTAIRNRLP